MTKYTADEFGVTKVSDLTNPDVATLFDTDGDGMGEVWIGASGLGIHQRREDPREELRLRRDDEPQGDGRDPCMAEVDNAVVQNKPLVFFCYTPNHMFALHDLIILDEPKHDPAKWNVVQPTDDPDWLAKSSAPVAWDLAYLHIHYAAAMELDLPEVASMLSKVKFDTDIVSAMTYALVVAKQESGRLREEVGRRQCRHGGALVEVMAPGARGLGAPSATVSATLPLCSITALRSRTSANAVQDGAVPRRSSRA